MMARLPLIELSSASVMQFNKKSLKSTAWASKLKPNKFDEFENEQGRSRKEIRNEVRDEVRSRDVYQAMDFLQ